jgi:hypothetical protein
VLGAAERIERHVERARGDANREAGARRLAFAIARTDAAARLLELAAWGEAHEEVLGATRRWLERDLTAGLE